MTDRPTKGFTLIELLVVIAIIALLVSILIPSLKRARAMAMTAVCSATVHTLGMGMQFYAGENNDALPWSWGNGADYNPWECQVYGGNTWATVIYEYVGGISAYACPSFAYSDNKPVYGQSNGQNYLIRSHYRGNLYLGWNGYGPGPAPGFQKIGGANGHRFQFDGTYETFAYPAKLGQISDASEKVCIFDAYADWQPYIPSPSYGRSVFLDVLGDGDRTNPDNYPNYWRKPNIGTWHDESTCIVFMDGHASTFHSSSNVTFGTGSFEDFDTTHWVLKE